MGSMQLLKSCNALPMRPRGFLVWLGNLPFPYPHLVDMMLALPRTSSPNPSIDGLESGIGKVKTCANTSRPWFHISSFLPFWDPVQSMSSLSTRRHFRSLGQASQRKQWGSNDSCKLSRNHFLPNSSKHSNNRNIVFWSDWVVSSEHRYRLKKKTIS